MTDDIVASARNVAPVHVGALDAIHIASALSLDTELAGVATYDNRMKNALIRAGTNVIALANRAPVENIHQTRSDAYPHQ